MVDKIIPADRHEQITKIIRKDKIVHVSELSRLLGVTTITIRRDLDILARRGILERSHGGAIYNERLRTEPIFSQKDNLCREEKKAIGREAAKLINNGDTVFIPSGSTTLQVINNLIDKNIRIITSNAGAIQVLKDHRIELILLGGILRLESNSIIGSLAMVNLEMFCASKVFVGADGFSFKYGLTMPIMEEAQIIRHMIKQTSGPVIAIIDHSKFGVVSDFTTASLKEIDILITDEGINREYQKTLEDIGIKFIIASLDPE